MSFLEGFFEFFTNSLPGAILDNTFGRGGDGVPHSSAESYVQPDAGQQKTDIHINAENINLNAENVNVIEQAARQEQPAQEAAAQQAPVADANEAHFATLQAQEQAFNRALQEQDQDNDLKMGY